MNLLSIIIPSYFHWWHLPIIFLAGLIGEGYGTIIGSGGLLIQFILLSLGMPLQSVIATDIAGSQAASIGVMSASPKTIWKNKHLLFLLTTPLFLGGIIGTIFLAYISTELLRYVLIAGLSLLLLYLLLGKQKTLQAPENLRIKLRHYPFLFSVLSVLGIYGNVS